MEPSSSSRIPPQGPIDQAAWLDVRQQFGRTAPLEVEIGAGQGGFAIGHATAHPERDLIALEVRQKFARYVEDRRRRRELRNLLVIGADAKVVLPRLLPPRSLSAIYIQFPDPWWKRRHHDRRLVEDDFSVLLYNLLRLDGVLELRTDVEARGREMAEVLEAVGFVNRCGSGGLAPAEPGEVPSTRERGYLQRGEPVFRYRLGRTEQPPRDVVMTWSRVGTADRKR